MNRFEHKILLAILLVALGPLVGSLILGQRMVNDTYRVGINEEFASVLAGEVEVHRAYLRTLRREAEICADVAVALLKNKTLLETPPALREARFRELLMPLTERCDQALAFRLVKDDLELLSFELERAGSSEWRTRELKRELKAGDFTLDLELEVGVPRAIFDAYQHVGEVSEVYSRLQQQSASVSRTYLYAYAGLLAVVIGVALLIGVILSRRVTRRVSALAEATRLVGRGDLSVALDVGSKDEVGDLISAFNQMVADLREYRDRIDYLQRVSGWQDFARRLAHEIKNPLTPIQLAAQEMVQSYEGSDASYRDKLRSAGVIIEEEVETLRRLVAEFSAFAKLPQAELSVSDLSEFVASLESSIPAILEDVGATGPAKVKVELQNATKPMLVRMDPMMLKRCLDNLIRNAVQAVHAHRAEGGGHVWVKTWSEDDCAHIEVKDDGPGVAPADRARVFDPYFTTKSSGTGLGLPIVKKIILEHDGKIELLAANGSGARFKLSLPLAEGP